MLVSDALVLEAVDRTRSFIEKPSGVVAQFRGQFAILDLVIERDDERLVRFDARETLSKPLDEILFYHSSSPPEAK